MDIKKISRDVWITAVLTYVTIIFVWGVSFTYQGTHVDIDSIKGFLVVAVISFIWTAISRITGKGRHELGFYIPSAIFAYGLFDLLTCTGKFCGFLGIFLMIMSGIALIFYALGLAIRKWGARFAWTIILIELIFIVGGGIFLVYMSHVKSFIGSVQKGEKISTQEIAQTCAYAEILNNDSANKMGDLCWEQAVIKNPDVDFCVLVDKSACIPFLRAKLVYFGLKIDEIFREDRVYYNQIRSQMDSLTKLAHDIAQNKYKNIDPHSATGQQEIITIQMTHNKKIVEIQKSVEYQALQEKIDEFYAKKRAAGAPIQTEMDKIRTRIRVLEGSTN